MVAVIGGFGVSERLGGGGYIFKDRASGDYEILWAVTKDPASAHPLTDPAYECKQWLPHAGLDAQATAILDKIFTPQSSRLQLFPPKSIPVVTLSLQEAQAAERLLGAWMLKLQDAANKLGWSEHKGKIDLTLKAYASTAEYLADRGQTNLDDAAKTDLDRQIVQQISWIGDLAKTLGIGVAVTAAVVAVVAIVVFVSVAKE